MRTRRLDQNGARLALTALAPLASPDSLIALPSTCCCRPRCIRISTPKRRAPPRHQSLPVRGPHSIDEIYILLFECSHEQVCIYYVLSHFHYGHTFIIFTPGFTPPGAEEYSKRLTVCWRLDGGVCLGLSFRELYSAILSEAVLTAKSADICPSCFVPVPKPLASQFLSLILFVVSHLSGS
jgi:hypothetical protein